jgi:hypothetical protein
MRGTRRCTKTETLKRLPWRAFVEAGGEHGLPFRQYQNGWIEQSRSW